MSASNGNAPGTDVQARIARLFVYPVKSCGGVELQEAVLTEAGLDLDRAWMVVDENREFVTQRELPRMALVSVKLRHSDVVLRAPGMLALHLQIEQAEAPMRVHVWDDVVPAYDMGDVAAQWFSDFLGARLRLVRFDPEHRRLSSMRWTGGVEAPNLFSDGFPLLAVGQASLDLLNSKLAKAGHAPVGIERFRPNIVLDGIDAHDEDRLGPMRVAADGPVLLQPVKPCPRCPIPNVDPATAAVSPEVGDTLQGYRTSPVVGGAVAFGMNLIVREGDGQVLRVGQGVSAGWKFD